MVDRKVDWTLAARGRTVQRPAARTAQRDARVVDAKLNSAAELSIDDGDYGVDPYNCTGRHTVLKKD